MEYGTVIGTLAMAAMLLAGGLFSIWLARFDNLEVI